MLARVRSPARPGPAAASRYRLRQSYSILNRFSPGHPVITRTRSVTRSVITRRAGLPKYVRMHDLRHAHASWLLAGGANILVVQVGLGHDSLTTTEKYLHTLPDADETALAALDRIRSRRGNSY